MHIQTPELLGIPLDALKQGITLSFFFMRNRFSPANFRKAAGRDGLDFS